MNGSAVFCIGSREEHTEIYGFLGDLARHGHQIYAIVPEALSVAFFARGVMVRTENDELTSRLIEADSFDMLVVGHDSKFGRQVLNESTASTKMLYQGRTLATSVSLLNMGDIITHVYGYSEENLETWYERFLKDSLDGPWLMSGDEDDTNLYRHLYELLTD